ncbi:hypothetical protein RRG08_002564 [Elysia crispata]|uniref:Uncharacterized protein n=1 Tax=Elysia crispata TaxID=231223 RepID=A0AAE0Y553_9GAST|nr:hypothetical protein RRG08_002564 [Elysia crispata]
MDEILRMYQDATGPQYDGNMYDIQDLNPNDVNESDVDIPVVGFEEESDSSGTESDEEDNLMQDRSRPGAEDDLDLLSDVTHGVFTENFVEACGPQHFLDEESEPYDYFSLIFSDDLYELIARETNSYAKYKQELARKLTKFGMTPLRGK